MGIKRPKRHAIVDGDAFIYRIGFACGEETEYVAIRTLRMVVEGAVRQAGARSFSIFISGGRETCFRSQRASILTYKGNRDKAERPRHYDSLRRELIRMGAVCIRGYEADDAMLSELSAGEVLVHVDKDIDTIPGVHYNWVREKGYQVSTNQARQNFYTQLFRGDVVDNIKGLSGAYLKRDKYLLDETATHYEWIRMLAPLYIYYYEVQWDKLKLDGPIDGQTAFIENASLLLMHDYSSMQKPEWYDWSPWQHTDLTRNEWLHLWGDAEAEAYGEMMSV